MDYKVRTDEASRWISRENPAAKVAVEETGGGVLTVIAYLPSGCSVDATWDADLDSPVDAPGWYWNLVDGNGDQMLAETIGPVALDELVTAVRENLGEEGVPAGTALCTLCRAPILGPATPGGCCSQECEDEARDVGGPLDPFDTRNRPDPDELAALVDDLLSHATDRNYCAPLAADLKEGIRRLAGR